MFAIIFFVLLGLFANEGKALKPESTCCDEIQFLLKNKTIAYKTVCLETESRLSSNCCKNIETEIEKHRYAYQTLCSGIVKPTVATTTETTARTTATTTTEAATESPVIRCDTPLGIENGSISDVAMTASSILNASSLPHFGRLGGQHGGCAWMPATNAHRNSSWLQVDLGNLTNVSAVAIQGSCSNDRWTKSYVIMYSENGVNWTAYEELGTTKLFIGNNDSTSIVTNYIKSPFVARFVKIFPRSWHKNPALRIELYTYCNSSFSVPNPKAPRSCLDHLNNGQKTNGYYSIYDASSNLMTVFCDMTSEPGKAWTLVMSLATKNKDMAEFQLKPFFKDAPVDETFPNWNRYRMSLTTINDLKSQSTHWRATCSFPTYGVDYVDYVRGKFVDFNIITFNGVASCKTVEHLNIRGHQCTSCTAEWWQDGDNIVHTDSSYHGCQFNGATGAVHKEDNFGFYVTINPKFRCTADQSATTNWWFGGNII